MTLKDLISFVIKYVLRARCTGCKSFHGCCYIVRKQRIVDRFFDWLIVLTDMKCIMIIMAVDMKHSSGVKACFSAFFLAVQEGRMGAWSLVVLDMKAGLNLPRGTSVRCSIAKRHKTHLSLTV